MSFFSAIIMGILLIFWEQLSIHSNNWYWWSLGVFAVVTALFFAFFGNKRRIAWNMHLQIKKKVVQAPVVR